MIDSKQITARGVILLAVTTDYVYENITSQYQLDENGNIINLAEFIYDSANEVIGFTYEGETYFSLTPKKGSKKLSFFTAFFAVFVIKAF